MRPFWFDIAREEGGGGIKKKGGFSEWVTHCCLRCRRGGCVRSPRRMSTMSGCPPPPMRSARPRRCNESCCGCPGVHTVFKSPPCPLLRCLTVGIRGFGGGGGNKRCTPDEGKFLDHFPFLLIGLQPRYMPLIVYLDFYLDFLAISQRVICL